MRIYYKSSNKPIKSFDNKFNGKLFWAFKPDGWLVINDNKGVSSSNNYSTNERLQQLIISRYKLGILHL
ncbi:hypothetical protein [Solitalea canadensis]|uniref:hypothetical protein n=1 Tax=Solitalea canadensis TaxID=995 RepID=UPI0005A6FC3A|nr:hypothetical protein [Solitalea canadensis]